MFKLRDAKADSWAKCAAINAARTRKGLNPKNKWLYLLKDLRVACALGKNNASIVSGLAFEENDDVRKTFEPLFEGEQHSFCGDYEKIRGKNLLFPGVSLDINTMQMTESDFDEREEYADYSTWSNEAVSPSGLVVRSERRDGFVRVVDKNDNLLHKKPRFRAKDGAYLIHEYMHSPEFRVPDSKQWDWETFLEGCKVSLLPGQGGARAVVSGMHEQGHRQMVMDIQPTEELERTLICTVPMSLGYCGSYTDTGKNDFYTFFDGYLFLLFSGRFFRLWVDLGYRSRFRGDLCIDNFLDSHAKDRCLVVWNRNFPVIGTLQEDNTSMPHGCEILRGPKNGRYANEFVSVASTNGQIFGHLLTGVTMFSSRNNEQRLTLPIHYDKGITFGSFGKYVSEGLLDTMIGWKVEGYDPEDADANEYYADILEGARDAGETREDRVDIEDEIDVPRVFDNFDRHSDEEYPWSDSDEEEVEEVAKPEAAVDGGKKLGDGSENDDDEDDNSSDLSSERERVTDYHDDADYEEDPVLYADIFKEIPLALNPSPMNSAKAFKRVGEHKEPEDTPFFQIGGPLDTGK
ncbi:hypothetical protein CJU89_6672 [Yarrowia sp. B02]|nr:hypothetical protein CJU89_6672 [Yarrowia sp. B02]